MKTSRLKLAVTLALALLLVVVVSAFAAPRATSRHIKVHRTDANIKWFEFIDPDVGAPLTDSCSGIPSGYEIWNDTFSSDRRKHANVQTLPNGRQRVTIWDTVSGTATDNYGGTYEWVYRNDVTINLVGGVATVEMNDFFEINGDVSHELAFSFRWQYYADDIPIVEIVEDGELVDFYAEFVWPTDDGVNETTNPAYVPGSWQILEDYGDWINCDPI